MKKLVVTGCSGYIGGTFCYEALKNGFEVLGIDNFISSDKKNVEIFKSRFQKFNFRELDLASQFEDLDSLLSNYDPDCIIHFAGLKSISESEDNPLLYWSNNVESTHNLLRSCKPGIKFIFSSSATVYGKSKTQPVKETHQTQSDSVYGSTKIASELLINDYSRTKGIKSISLRYFNPVGSHEEGLITENYDNNLSNLMPNIVSNLLNEGKTINVYGNDYDTYDGTCERDFIHIMDLIDGHFESMKYKQEENFEVFNLGTGKATSVLKLIEMFNSVNKTNLKINFSSRRKGDVAICYADPTLIRNKLGWKAKRSIKKMCVDVWESVK